MKSLIVLILVLFSFGSTYAERLVLVSASYGKNILAITDANGKVLWKFKTNGPQKGHVGHHDVHMLKNGNILYHDDWTRIKEISLNLEKKWQYDSGKSNGNHGKRVDVHAFARLENGNTRIVESKIGRVIEVNTTGDLIHTFPLKPGGTTSTRWARSTDSGTILICSEQPGVVTEYDLSTGKVVWDFLVGTRVYGAIRLKNGNTLIASGSGKSVLEVTPEKKVVWEISKRVPGTKIELGWMTCLQELENGNFMIGNCHAGSSNPQIFEINRQKEVVWQFNQWNLVGDGLACWQILEGQRAIEILAWINDAKSKN